MSVLWSQLPTRGSKLLIISIVKTGTYWAFYYILAFVCITLLQVCYFFLHKWRNQDIENSTICLRPQHTPQTLSSLLTCPGIHICLLFLWPPLPYSFQVLFNFFLLVPWEFHTMNLTILPLSTLPRSTPLPYPPNLCLLPTPSAPIKYSLWCPHFPVWPVTVVYSTYLFSCEEMVDPRRRQR